jgi:hypothetical protein
MKPSHRRPPRYAFVAQVQITDLDSEITVHGVTNDPTLFGFSVTVNIPFAGIASSKFALHTATRPARCRAESCELTPKVKWGLRLRGLSQATWRRWNNGSRECAMAVFAPI